jgi:hypothetical protein
MLGPKRPGMAVLIMRGAGKSTGTRWTNGRAVVNAK